VVPAKLAGRPARARSESPCRTECRGLLAGLSVSETTRRGPRRPWIMDGKAPKSAGQASKSVDMAPPAAAPHCACRPSRLVARGAACLPARPPCLVLLEYVGHRALCYQKCPRAVCSGPPLVRQAGGAFRHLAAPSRKLGGRFREAREATAYGPGRHTAREVSRQLVACHQRRRSTCHPLLAVTNWVWAAHSWRRCLSGSWSAFKPNPIPPPNVVHAKKTATFKVCSLGETGLCLFNSIQKKKGCRVYFQMDRALCGRMHRHLSVGQGQKLQSGKSKKRNVPQAR
jgi:hypothetical protein